MKVVVYTLGHSTMTLEDFSSLLGRYAIRRLVDVRTIPRSRHNPQFNGDALGPALGEIGVEYLQMKELGGLRRPRADSPNMGWCNDSFRGYADYMQTTSFAAAMERLVQLATEKTTAIMCAEAVPWRCHRSLIGDALLVRRIEVNDLIGPSSCRKHALSSMAKVDGLRIIYPALSDDLV